MMRELEDLYFPNCADHRHLTALAYSETREAWEFWHGHPEREAKALLFFTGPGFHILEPPEKVRETVRTWVEGVHRAVAVEA